MEEKTDRHKIFPFYRTLFPVMAAALEPPRKQGQLPANSCKRLQIILNFRKIYLNLLNFL